MVGGGIPLGLWASMNCPAPAVCQLGLLTPQLVLIRIWDFFHFYSNTFLSHAQFVVFIGIEYEGRKDRNMKNFKLTGNL
jgi:hypothetical protein